MGQLPRERRITTRREIGALLGERRIRGQELELYWRPATGPLARATCITPKFGHSSVERNRLRRRLKELTREILLRKGEGRDWLVRARRPAYDLSYMDLTSALSALAAKAGAAEGAEPEVP